MQQEAPLARSPSVPIRRSSTLSRVKRFGSMLVRTNSSSKKKAIAVQHIFTPPPITTTHIDEAGPCYSSHNLSSTDDDDDEEDEQLLATPTSDVAPSTALVQHNQVSPPRPIELNIAPVKQQLLNPTTMMIRSELLRTFEQVDNELEAELDLKRSQMIQSLNTRPRYVF
jgi:hypothetical protein